MHRQAALRWHPALLILPVVVIGFLATPVRAQESPPSSQEVKPPGKTTEDDESRVDTEGAAQKKGRSAGHFQLEAVSEFPVQIGAGFQAEFNSRIQFRTTIGVVPAAYLGIANDMLVGISDEYSRREADLIENVLERSLMWRAFVGFRPFKDLGLYIQTGYSMVTLTGSTTNTALLVDLNEGRLTEEEEEELRNNFANETLDAQSTLHQWGVEIGYDWGITPHLRVRTALGWAYTFSSSSNVEAQFSADRARAQRIIENFENVGETYIDESMQSSVHPPWLTLGIAYRF
jgi:hypothetical protein